MLFFQSFNFFKALNFYITVGLQILEWPGICADNPQIGLSMLPVFC